MIESDEVAALLAECHEFVSRIADDDALEILLDFEAELLEHDTVALMVGIRSREIDPTCSKSTLNRFLGYCRGIVCDSIIKPEEAQGIVRMVAENRSLLETVGVREIYNTCIDAFQDGIVTREESELICNSIVHPEQRV